MPDTYLCCKCKKTKLGRFTRPRNSAQGDKKHLPAWWCWQCLPAGEGRDETPMTKATEKPKAKVLVGTLIPTKTPKPEEGTALIAPLKADLITVIETPEQLQQADLFLARVQQARKTWNVKMYGTKAAPGPIPSIRSGLDQLYALNREVDGPLELMENAVKQLMSDFKLLELRAAQQLQREKEERDAALQQEQEALAARLASAKTQTAKAVILEQVVRVEIAIEEAQEEPAIELTPTLSSSYEVKRPTVRNLYDFCRGVADGLIPMDCIEVKQGTLNRYYKDDPETTAAYPGVLIVSSMQIVGRG